jgi:chromosome segregation ATPase
MLTLKLSRMLHEELKQQTSSLQEANGNLTKQLDEAKQQVNSLQEANKNLEQTSQTANSEIMELKSKNDELQGQLTNLSKLESEVN